MLYKLYAHVEQHCATYEKRHRKIDPMLYYGLQKVQVVQFCLFHFVTINRMDRVFLADVITERAQLVMSNLGTTVSVFSGALGQ
jgi:hypothetical protein